MTAAWIDFGAPLQMRQLREVRVARQLHEVRPLLDAVWQQALAGRWCVGFVRYEAAPAFDAAFEVHPSDAPLAWFAVFDDAQPAPLQPAGPAPQFEWRRSIERAQFDADIAAIHRAIAQGEVYQVNHTAPLHADLGEGDPVAAFLALQQAQPRAYAAFIDTGDTQVLSVSPELFFDWRDGVIVSRPMKGTAPRGATPQADAAAAQALRASEKERAENLMIVDLIRNDLSRIAQPFTVRVPRLFDTEALPTAWQMTSDVSARTRAGTSLADVFAALFPCGSITGAPKVQAMRWIRRLERAPRGVYCGAVGVVRPGGHATFNVAIRTVEIRGRTARCGIGSGITIDAQARDEWREWRVKRGFLERASRPFALLETLRLQDGALVHAELHLARLARAAAHFGFPADPSRLRERLQAQARSHPQGTWRLRLALDAAGHADLTLAPLAPTPAPVTVALAAQPLDPPSFEFVRFKTTRREHYERLAPTAPQVFDTLLYNDDGELTEFTRGNAAFLIDGRWVTPPLACGLLDGVGRECALREGRLVEAVVRLQDLPRVQALAFVNSLRGWLEARWA